MLFIYCKFHFCKNKIILKFSRCKDCNEALTAKIIFKVDSFSYVFFVWQERALAEVGHGQVTDLVDHIHVAACGLKIEI